MFAILFIEPLRNLFNLVVLPKEKLIETIVLVFSPIVIVEIFKLLKINGNDKMI